MTKAGSALDDKRSSRGLTKRTPHVHLTQLAGYHGQKALSGQEDKPVKVVVSVTR